MHKLPDLGCRATAFIRMSFRKVASKNNKMLMSGNLLNVPLFTGGVLGDGAEKVKYKRKESKRGARLGSIFNCSLRLDLLQIFINTLLLLKNRTPRRDRIIYYYLHLRLLFKESFCTRALSTPIRRAPQSKHQITIFSVPFENLLIQEKL